MTNLDSELRSGYLSQEFRTSSACVPMANLRLDENLRTRRLRIYLISFVLSKVELLRTEFDRFSGHYTFLFFVKILHKYFCKKQSSDLLSFGIPFSRNSFHLVWMEIDASFHDHSATTLVDLTTGDWGLMHSVFFSYASTTTST